MKHEEAFAHESAQAYDAVFGNQKECIYILFINTKLRLPDSSEVTAEDFLDAFKDYCKSQGKKDGYQIDYKDRTTVTIGGDEYIRDICYYDGDETDYSGYCVRKLDDDLLCEINYYSCDPEKTPEYYESLFEELK